MMTRKEILQQLTSEYEQRRMANRALEGQRRAEAEAHIPELAQVLQARQDLIFSSVHGILEGHRTYEDIPAQMEVLNRRVTSLLEGAGYPADWLDPIYTCGKCKDTGYAGEPIRDMCDCMRTAYYARLYA